MSYQITENLEKQKIELEKELSDLTSKKPTHRRVMTQSLLIRRIKVIDQQIREARTI
jgi:hypothetical protein